MFSTRNANIMSTTAQWKSLVPPDGKIHTLGCLYVEHAPLVFNEIDSSLCVLKQTNHISSSHRIGLIENLYRKAKMIQGRSDDKNWAGGEMAPKVLTEGKRATFRIDPQTQFNYLEVIRIHSDWRRFWTTQCEICQIRDALNEPWKMYFALFLRRIALSSLNRKYTQIISVRDSKKQTEIERGRDRERKISPVPSERVQSLVSMSYAPSCWTRVECRTNCNLFA